jgi:hypothetical protein
MMIYIFSSTTPPMKIPDAPPLPFSLSNSSKTPVLITTSFPSEPKESSPSPPIAPTINEYHQQPRIIERKTSIKATSPVRIAANIEIGRLVMEDIAKRELDNMCELYYQDILEEIIQSDFEKPSIPEVILAVITDLTHDDDDGDEQQPMEFEDDDDDKNSVYYFNQDKLRSDSPLVMNTNGDIDDYYTRVHQAVTNGNDHGSVRSTNSSDQSIAIIPIVDQTSNYLQVIFNIF